MGFLNTLSCTMTFPSAYSLDCKGYWIFSLPETGTLNQGCIAVLFSRTAGQVPSSVCFSSTDLAKFRWCSKAEGVVLCHRAGYCRLSSSWNNTEHDWRWQIKQQALSLVYTKDTIPEAAVSECWGALMGRSCHVLVSEVCEAGAAWTDCAVKKERTVTFEEKVVYG